MFNIDFDVISKPKSDTDNEISESHCNDIFHGIINENLMHPFHNSSSCFGCTIDNIYKIPFDDRRIVEVECHGNLESNYCELSNNINYDIKIDDLVVINCDDGIESAKVVLVGDTVKIKRQRLGLYGEELPILARKLGRKEIGKYEKNLTDSDSAKQVFREKTEKYQLEMKLVGTHYQFDRKKLYFFYTADGRIDFRELAKDLASEFKTRIELRQIGFRDEAKRVGGIGVCGREYCCTSFMSDFKKVSNHGAIDQINNSNLSKMSGPCNKIKCCLAFELEN